MRDLTVSQKLAIGAFAVIALIAIFWGVQLSAQQEKVVLLNQGFDQEQLTRIINKLDQWAEKYEVKGNQILVPRSRANALSYKLASEDALPDDISAGFMKRLEDNDIWTPASVRENKDTIALQVELAATINTFPGVDSAKVFINRGDQRRLNNMTPIATASVSVKLSSGKAPNRKLATAIAGFVGSAVNRLKRENVEIIMNGSLIPVVAEDQEFGTDYLEQKLQYEKYFREKILDVLPIPNVLVQVDAKPRNTHTKKQEEKISPEGNGSLVVAQEETATEENNNRTMANREPGMMANVPDNNSGSNGTTQSETREDTSRRNTVIPGSTIIEEITPAGGIPREDITATVSVPLEYFEGLAKREAGGDAEPDDAAVKAVMEREIPNLKEVVMRALNLHGEDYAEQVFVSSYWAGGLVAAAGAGAGGLDGAEVVQEGSVGGIAKRYGKHIAVSVLAMFSLMMVLMMVRRSTSVTDLTDEEAAMLTGKPPLDALGVEESPFADSDEVGGLPQRSGTGRRSRTLPAGS